MKQGRIKRPFSYGFSQGMAKNHTVGARLRAIHDAPA